MEPFYFILFGKKQLQTAPEVAGEALANGPLLRLALIKVDLYHFPFSKY
jgi:hypothetical protein